MNEVRTIVSWIIICLSVLALLVLLWFSTAKQFDTGVHGAFSALFDPSYEVEKPEIVGSLPTEPVSIARSSLFTLDRTGMVTQVRAELPEGEISQSVWEALNARSDDAKLRVQIEEYAAAESSDAQWTNKLPEFIKNLPEQTENSDLHLIITDQKSSIIGKVDSAEEKEQLTRALSEIAPAMDMSSESLKVTNMELPALSIEKNGNVLELKGQLASELQDSGLGEELKRLTNSSELIDNLSYSPEISNTALDLDNLGDVSELLAKNGSRAVIDWKDQEYTMDLFGYSGDNPDELRVQVAELLGETPFTLAVGSVGSEEFEVLPETPGEQNEQTNEGKIIAVNFGFNSYTLTPESEPALGVLLEQMSANPELHLVIEGHTDSIGNPDSNQLLSQQRADAVKSYLIESGISTTRIKALGFGDEKPISSNDTSEGRFKNRRIEVREE